MSSHTLQSHSLTTFNINKLYEHRLCATAVVFYYIGKSVLVENRPLIKFIRNYIRDLSGIFSISSPVRISMTSFPALTLLFVQKHSCLYNKNIYLMIDLFYVTSRKYRSVFSLNCSVWEQLTFPTILDISYSLFRLFTVPVVTSVSLYDMSRLTCELARQKVKWNYFRLKWKVDHS